MKRENFSSGTEWEKFAGYSRAVKLGNIVEVAGTTAVDDRGNVVGEGDIYLQTKFVLAKIAAALAHFGVSIDNVVRTRIYVTDIEQWEKAARAHGEFFETIRPASTLVQVSALVNPALLVEIEATAIAGATDQ